MQFAIHVRPVVNIPLCCITVAERSFRTFRLLNPRNPILPSGLKCLHGNQTAGALIEIPHFNQLLSIFFLNMF